MSTLVVLFRCNFCKLIYLSAYLWCFSTSISTILSLSFSDLRWVSSSTLRQPYFYLTADLCPILALQSSIIVILVLQVYLLVSIFIMKLVGPYLNSFELVISLKDPTKSTHQILKFRATSHRAELILHRTKFIYLSYSEVSLTVTYYFCFQDYWGLYWNSILKWAMICVLLQ